MRPVVYSASSVNRYQDCHLAWWFSYVALERGVESDQQRVGIQVHEYAERQLRRVSLADERSIDPLDLPPPRDTSRRQ